MKSIFTCFSLLLALALTSCLEHKSTLSLNKDGSGTITETSTFGAQAVAMMEQMAQMGGDQGAGISGLTDRRKAEARAKEMGEGVTVKEVVPVEEEQRKGGRVVFAFEDINKLKYAPGQSLDELGPGDEAKKKAAEAPSFSYADGVLTIKDLEPNDGEKSKGSPEEIDDMQLEMMKPMFEGMRVTFEIELPGGIAETNASHVEGNTVTLFDIDMGKLLEDPERFKDFARSQPETLAEMKEAAEGVEGIKVETTKTVTITLK